MSNITPARKAKTTTVGDLQCDKYLELTILMPCLNEAKTLPACIEKAFDFLVRARIVGEVLVVDNGSTDGSADIAKQHGARVVSEPTRGYGAALKKGISCGKGRFVIMGDADDSYDFNHLQPFVGKLRAGYELVMGNRFAGGIAPGAMPFLHRYLGNPVLSFLGRLFFKVQIHDFQCGLRGFCRKAMLDVGLKTIGMEFASEMVVRSSLAGLKVTEVPTVLSPDGRGRQPHLRTWRDGWRYLRFLLLYSPRWLFLYPGMVILAAGALLALALVPGPISISEHVTLDVHSLVIACLAMLVGAQCISFAVVSRGYASKRGLLPPSKRLDQLSRYFTLERFLLLSAAMFTAAMCGIFYSVYYWSTVHFGSIEYGTLIRIVIISSTFTALALQIAFTAFLSAILSMD